MLAETLFWGIVCIVIVALGVLIPPLGLLLVVGAVVYACYKLFSGEWS
jgi:TRAP-type C4-dicarboxylate transport system permease large subunit